MKSNKEFRDLASEKISKKSNLFALIFFLYSLILGAVSAASMGIAGFLISGPLAFGVIKCVRMAVDGKEEEINVGTMFSKFEDFGPTFLITFLSSLFIGLWSLLFVVPGIIATLAYSMAPYIHEDHPELGAFECIQESKKLMKGHKGELFGLYLSYFGWYLLCFLTLGILSFWVYPKVEAAKYLFYKEITKKDRLLEY